MPDTVLVTGGGGFLGSRLVELLLDAGHDVRFLARGRYPEVEARGARGVQADLRDAAALHEAFRGVATVHHVASKAGYWGSRDEFESVNVRGTENVLAAARACGVRRVVYTSTPSVIGYRHDACGIADAPYPDRWESPYGETKARAEQLVLAANGGDLATTALRPHLVVGPRDNHLLPRVIARARQGRLAIIGDGQNRVDVTYVDNAAWAHVDAAAALTAPDAPCAGRAYFVSNDQPVLLWEWVNALLPRVGVAPVTRRIGFGTASAIGAVMELAWRLLPLPGEPRMTRFLAAAMARSHWYSMEPAKRDLGYRVRVSLAEGTDRTVAWLRDQNPVQVT